MLAHRFDSSFALCIAVGAFLVWAEGIASAGTCPVHAVEVAPGLAIPDIEVIVFDIEVPEPPECPFIDDIDVDLLIPHTWQGNLLITMSRIGGPEESVLMDQPGAPQTFFGFSADNYGNPATLEYFTLDDEADALYDSRPFGPVTPPGIPNVIGNWLPQTPLSVFDGMKQAGTWRLTIEDFGGGDVGTLERVQLRFAGAVPEPGMSMAVILLITLQRRRRRGSPVLW